MIYHRTRFICVLLLFTSCVFSVFSNENGNYKEWSHLELGAGNYGADGHTKASQAMTVLMKLEHVSDKKNYVDDLEEMGLGDYKPEDQYGVLFWTLDQLIACFGNKGIFHINDLYEEYALFAKQKLEDYAISKGYDSVIIEVIPGDYQYIDAKKTLSAYGKTKYTSIHLKNPELSFYHNRMDGDLLFSSEESRDETRAILQRLANLSEDGLYLFILDHENYIPTEERVEFIEKDIFYRKTTNWEAVPYIFPEGYVIDKQNGKVFHIEAIR